MITVSKGVLEQKIHEYFQEVEEKGEDIIVTNNKIAVFKIVSLRRKKNREVDDVFADLRGKIKYHADILEPETGEWGEI